MRIVITTTHVPFIEGGAETHAQSLKEALLAKGHETEIVKIPFKWYPPEKIHEHVLACRLLDLTESNGMRIDRVIGLKFPAYHVVHPNKVTWVLHQFRTAFEMWGSEHCDLSPVPHGKAVRDSLESVERALLPEARALYANSKTVADRMKAFCGIDSEPLYHPPQNAEAFGPGEYGDYLYFPSRINRWKRQKLAIEALALTKQPVVIRFSGAPDNQEYQGQLEQLSQKLKVADRIHFLGRLPFDGMVQQYSNCRGVLFIPEQEDYGYITLEGMLSSKAVITCKDSGGPTEFIQNGEEGFVTDPNPKSIAEAMDELWASSSFAREAGMKARSAIDSLGINWDTVVSKLIQ